MNDIKMKERLRTIEKSFRLDDNFVLSEVRWMINTIRRLHREVEELKIDLKIEKDKKDQ